MAASMDQVPTATASERSLLEPARAVVETEAEAEAKAEEIANKGAHLRHKGMLGAWSISWLQPCWPVVGVPG